MMMRLTSDEAPDHGPESIYRSSNAVEPDLGDVYVLDTTFKSAMAYASNSGGRNALLIIDPRKMVAITCARDDVRRVRASLAAGQKSIRKALYGQNVKAADDPASVKVSVFKTASARATLSGGLRGVVNRTTGLGGSTDWRSVGGEGNVGGSKVVIICLHFSTPEQSFRALEMLKSSYGLELYASDEAMREAARMAMRKAVIDQREQMRLRQIEALGERTIFRESDVAQDFRSTEETQIQQEVALDG